MRYPRFLQPGGTIGFVAPSFACTTEPYATMFAAALQSFRARGYNVDLGPNTDKNESYGKSNTGELCGAEINEYYKKRGVDVLISCGGGELMCEDIDHFDFDAIRNAEPRWFMGYSDNTNLTYLLTTLCDTASIYGPCAAAFGMKPWHASLEASMKLLEGHELTVRGYDMWESMSEKEDEDPLAPYHLTEKKVLVKHPDTQKVSMSGRLIGGCMDCLEILAGTAFDKTPEFLERYKKDGFIWFLEACDLNVMSIRRTLWKLEHTGWFRYVKGFMFGRPLHFGEDLMGLDQYEAVTGILAKYKVPIVMDMDLGHLPPAMPLICGSMADIRVDGNEIAIDMKLQ